MPLHQWHFSIVFLEYNLVNYIQRTPILAYNLTKYVEQQFNLSPLKCDKIKIAGLLHDLGKLRIPDAILGKTAVLTEMERSIMNHHICLLE